MAYLPFRVVEIFVWLFNSTFFFLMKLGCVVAKEETILMLFLISSAKMVEILIFFYSYSRLDEITIAHSNRLGSIPAKEDCVEFCCWLLLSASKTYLI